MDTQGVETDLAALEKLAFHRREKSGEVVQEWHAKQDRLRKHRDFEMAARAYRWLFVPLTLWPIDIHGLIVHLANRLQKSKRLEQRLLMLIALLGEPPAGKVQETVSAQEFQVEVGKYEQLIRSQHKFGEMEEKLGRNKRFREEWDLIKEGWDITAFKNRSGVLRRRMVQERGFRTDWPFKWTTERARFQFVFDAFCQRWDLYGMLNDKPLLLKLTINLTPHGTLIMVPRYWSFDARRDLHWKPISKLLKVHGAHRQGAKLIQNRRERQKEAVRAKEFFVEATNKGLRGMKRSRFIMDSLRWHPGTDVSRLQQLLKEV